MKMTVRQFLDLIPKFREDTGVFLPPQQYRHLFGRLTMAYLNTDVDDPKHDVAAHIYKAQSMEHSRRMFILADGVATSDEIAGKLGYDQAGQTEMHDFLEHALAGS